MRFFSNKIALALLTLLILIVLIPLIMLLLLAGRNNKRQPSMPASHLGTSQTLEEAAFWLVSSYNVSVCSSASSRANAPSTLRWRYLHDRIDSQAYGIVRMNEDEEW